MLLIFIVVLLEFIFSILTADRTPNMHTWTHKLLHTRKTRAKISIQQIIPVRQQR